MAFFGKCCVAVCKTHNLINLNYFLKLRCRFKEGMYMFCLGVGGDVPCICDK